VVTDDSSARILIGRHGATVDAVEHLVERMASAAHGDRVRMNLDINNYRRRREDSLVSRVAEAVARVKASGQEYHLEPMNARERRIVHLETARTKGLQTFTIGEEGDKHVVISVDDGKPHPEAAESAATDMAAGDAARDDGQAPGTTGGERFSDPSGASQAEPQA
jgi:spoIIIJ-associated protein